MFYIGYLSQQDNLTDDHKNSKSTINSPEQQLARLLFKVTVELGKLSHLFAAANDVYDEALYQLHYICINEVRKINGIMDCENKE